MMYLRPSRGCWMSVKSGAGSAFTPCLKAPADKLTPDLLKKMLAGENGISTSYFQLYDGPDGTVTIALNNFCKLLDLGPEDEDDILSCVHFLLADVIAARDLVG